MFNKEKGFTLIELLVVIAIIGILAAIVIISINPGEQQKKAKDSSIKANLNSMRTQAVLEFQNSGTYASVCASTSTPGRAFAAASDNSSAANCYTSTTGDSFAAQAQLNESTTQYFCVDNAGFAGVVDGSSISSSDFKCGN